MSRNFFLLFAFLILALLGSMVYNLRAVSSISIMTILFVSLMYKRSEVLREGRSTVWSFVRGDRRYFWVFCIPVIVVLLSFWQTYDWGYWMGRIRVKTSFVVLPLSFLLVPKLTWRQLRSIFIAFIILMAVTNVVILAQALSQWQTLLDKLMMGQPMWTPCDHIRYSLLLATSVLLGSYCAWDSPKGSRERYWLVGLTVFSFVFLHFLAVKSGIVVLYTSLVLTLIFLAVQYKLWLPSAVALGLFLSTVTVIYWSTPTLQAKVRYTLFDIQQFLQGGGGSYSDSGRLAAWSVGLEIASEHPVIGVGAGNLRAEVKRIFNERYPKYVEEYLPPNQFLYVLAGTGIVGLLFYLYGFFLPFFHQGNYKEPLFFAFYVSQIISVIIEHALENSVGIFHYLIFTLLLLSVEGRKRLESEL